MIYAIYFREELVCLLLLTMLGIYARAFMQEEHTAEFGWLNHRAILHLLLEAGTVLVVNAHLPIWIGKIGYGLSGGALILFCGMLADVAVGRRVNNRVWELGAKAVLAASGFAALIGPILPMGTTEIAGMRFGIGGVCWISKAAALAVLIVALVLAVKRCSFQSLRDYGIPGTLIFMAVTTLAQTFFPQILFLGAAETVTVVVVFITVVSPTERYKQAYMDEAAKIKNKNCFTRDIAIVEKKLEEHPQWTLACVSVDMDYLKAINDNYGHEMGDIYLRKTAEIIQGALSNAYGVYRTGGDEFVAIYLNTAARPVERDVKLARNRILEAEPECPICLSVSLGIAWRKDGQTAAEVIREADQVMYDEKRKNHAERPRG